MFTDILSEFSDKEVEIITSSKKSYTGILRHLTSQNVVVIAPTENYIAKRYGPVFIREEEVVSVREVFPCVEEDLDSCEDACCSSL